MVSRDSSRELAVRLKADQIFADLDEMQRAREIATLQSNQGQVHYLNTNRSTTATMMQRVLNSHN